MRNHQQFPLGGLASPAGPPNCTERHQASDLEASLAKAVVEARGGFPVDPHEPQFGMASPRGLHGSSSRKVRAPRQRAVRPLEIRQPAGCSPAERLSPSGADDLAQQRIEPAGQGPVQAGVGRVASCRRFLRGARLAKTRQAMGAEADRHLLGGPRTGYSADTAKTAEGSPAT